MMSVREAVATRSRWPRFIFRRSVRLAISLVGILTVSFLMIQLIPGDPVLLALGPNAPASAIRRLRSQLGLDHSLATQYYDYLSRALHGHFGTSLITNEPVSHIIRTRGVDTAELVGFALALTLACSIVIGMTLGAMTQTGHGRKTDLAFTSLTSLFATVPEFLLGVGLVYFFAVRIRLFPVAGAAGFSSLVLPAIAIASGPTASLSRIVRTQTRVVLEADYMRLARSKGLPARLIYARHALPNVLTAALTVGGLLLGVLVASSVVVENVFARPGLGTVIVQAIVNHDYPVVQGILFVLGAGVLLINFAVDVLLSVLDPRSVLRVS